MLTLPASVRIFFATAPVDMRKSIDGLAGLVTENLDADPFSGFLFVFRGRRCDRIKILLWDRNGFVMLYKRLEKNRFRFPKETSSRIELGSTQLALLLDGLDVELADGAPRWRPAPPPLHATGAHAQGT